MLLWHYLPDLELDGTNQLRDRVFTTKDAKSRKECTKWVSGDETPDAILLRGSVEINAETEAHAAHAEVGRMLGLVGMPASSRLLRMLSR